VEINYEAGAIIGQFYKEELTPVIHEVEKIKKDFTKATKYNYKLAGNISKEFELTESKRFLESLMLPFVMKHSEIFKEMPILTNDVPITLQDLWVNFQAKYEFNPLHCHDGLFSFVLWLDIPFSNKDELQMPHVKDSNSQSAGNFIFVVSGRNGVETIDLPVDKEWNYKFALFRADLIHTVYPFYTSDNYRVSVSGNFYYLT